MQFVREREALTREFLFVLCVCVCVTNAHTHARYCIWSGSCKCVESEARVATALETLVFRAARGLQRMPDQLRNDSRAWSRVPERVQRLQCSTGGACFPATCRATAAALALIAEQTALGCAAAIAQTILNEIGL
jgi:hypothetical protein